MDPPSCHEFTVHRPGRSRARPRHVPGLRWRWSGTALRNTGNVMTLTQLNAFVLVARLGSVTAAANALGVSESAVSQALSALR
ncbi:MAG: LysR family transcriptional regulator, partial [Streptosporangiaceae bacterium]